MNRVQIQFIKDAMEWDHLLTAWEFDFINNLASKDNEKYELSKTENTILNRISDKINSR